MHALTPALLMLTSISVSGAAPPRTIVLHLPAMSTGTIPDVFSARFSALMRRAATATRPVRGDGRTYLTDEGSRWGGRGQLSLLERYLAMPQESPGRHRAERFLEEQGDSDGTLSEREKDRFAEMVAFTYFSAWRKAIHEVESRGRYAGGRFAPPPPAPALRGMRRALSDPARPRSSP
jgi:hypothetical protein